MREIAGNHNVTPSEVAINWLLKDNDIIPIVGTKELKHLENNIHATQWTLSEEEISQLNSVSDDLDLNLDWFDRVSLKEE